MAAAGITKRWVRGSLLITVLVILAAEVMFLSHRHPYPGRTAWDGHSFPI